MSSFVDRQFCLTGQHVQNAQDLSPAKLSGNPITNNNEDLKQLEAEENEEETGGIRQPLSLDLGYRSKLGPLRGRRTIRQASYTSDLDLSPSTELSPWHEPHLAAKERRWSKERIKQWTDPQLESTGFQDANPSAGDNLSHSEGRNKGLRDGVGGVGREGGEEKVNDAGSDSDSGKGTVSDCRESPTEEISFPESTIAEPCKQSVCPHSLETTLDNWSRTIETPFGSQKEHRKYERTLDDEKDCIGPMSCLTELQVIRDSKPMLHHHSDFDCYPALPDSPLGVTRPERPSCVELYLPTGSHGRGQSQGDRSVGDKRFPGDVGVHGIIDLNNNNYFEVPTPSRVDDHQCHDAVTSVRHGSKVDLSLEIKGTPRHARYCEDDIDDLDASHDIGSSRRELQAKCQDMYGSRPSILGSHDARSRHDSCHDVRDIHGSYHDVSPRQEAQEIHHDAYGNHSDIKDGHYNTYDIRDDVYDSHYGDGGRCDVISSSQAYHRGRDFQAGPPNNAHVIRSSLDGFPTRHESTHASHDSIHGNSQRSIDYSQCHVLVNFPSTISTEDAFGVAPSDLKGRRYVRREPVAALGVGASRNSPQKGPRYTRKGPDNAFVTVSESDPELFHEDFDKPQRNITPAQYRRIRSVPHDCATAGPRVLGSTHPALQQPFSDQEAVTLPRPAKPGRSAAATSAVEQHLNSCGQAEVKGRRLRQTRRWTSTGLSGAEPGMDEFQQRTKTTRNQSGSRFRVPSFFKSRKDSSSIAAIGTGIGTIPGNGIPVRSGTTASNRARTISDCETESKARMSSGNAAESGFETGSSLGSAGDISLCSISLGSTPSVFDTIDTTLPFQGVNVGDDHFRRSVSVPNPDRKSRSSASFLDILRARLTPRKRSSPAKTRITQSEQKKFSPSNDDGLTETQNHEEIKLAVLPPVITQDTGASSGQIDGYKTGRYSESPMTAVSRTTVSNTTTFGTFTPTRSPERDVKNVNDAETIFSSAPSPASTSSAAASAASAALTLEGLEGCHSQLNAGQMKSKKAPPSEECVNAVSEMVYALEGLIVFVNSSVTSVTSAEKTITADEFKEYRSLMIDAVKDLNQTCKQMVIKTPQSEPAFLQALRKCHHSLDGVADKCSALIDCASLPSDRSKVATPVIAVATSLRETVTVAYRLAGCPARDPAMLRLRRKADQLVGDLGLLMQSVREMTYNRLSRRF